MEPAQATFAAEVEAYETGLFRGNWEEIGELLSIVSSALAQVGTLAGRLSFTPIGAPMNVEWLTAPDPRDQYARFGDSAVEVYLTPVEMTLSRARLREAGQIVPRLLRWVGGVGHNEAIDVVDRPDGGAVARVARDRRARSFNQEVLGGTVEGVSVTRASEVCAWTSLPRDMFGAVVNAASLSELTTPLVVLAGRVLGEVAGSTSMAVVPSIALTGAGSVSIGDPRVVGTRSAAQIPMRGPSVVTLPGDESAILTAVVSGARDVGVELAARAEQALRNR